MLSYTSHRRLEAAELTVSPAPTVRVGVRVGVRARVRVRAPNPNPNPNRVEVGRREGAEARSEDVAIIRAGQLSRVEVDGRRVDHLEADVLALTVAIEPKAQPAAAVRLLPKVLHDTEPLGGLLDHLVRLGLVIGRVRVGPSP